MRKALIIGCNGFAGTALRRELAGSGEYDVYGVDIASFDNRTRAVDMLDYEAAAKAISDCMPDVIFNLAGQASPWVSWEKINFTMHLNVDLSVNIVEAVRKHCPKARMIFIGSANQYDLSSVKDGLVGEDTPLVDNSPYAVSKNTQEAIIRLMARKYDLDIVFTRSFNHVGPGQKVGFVITDYCNRIVKLENGEIDTFEYGDLDSWRDFSDVRDVVHAYRLIAENGRSGEIYNVGSGKSYYIRDLVGKVVELSPKAMVATKLPERLPDDALIHYRSDNSKLAADTGFMAIYDVNETVESVLQAYRQGYQFPIKTDEA